MTPLEDLLQQCTVKITVPGGWGTGFFVATGLILTCAHVVRKAVDLQVTVSYPAWRQPLSAIVKARADDGKTLELALIELSEPLPDHPCVLLDDEPVAIGQALYSYGYLESYTNAAPVRPVNEGLTGDMPPLLKLQGAQIEKGISGAALLNLKTGKVCGMVKETRAAGFDLGGGAIPTRVILEQLPELRSLQQQFHEKNRRWANLITTQPDIDFQPYLNSIATTYAKWQRYYTLTDAEGKSLREQESAPLFDFGLMVQTVLKEEREQPQREQPVPEKVERFSVLDGLRKYALGKTLEPVLLIGRPGSGKSTALARLMLEGTTLTPSPSPNSGRGEPERIPVLVELRYWQGALSDLIHNAIARHDATLKAVPLDRLLINALLLFDGVNELPSEEARSQLMEFRHNHPKVPMIFTTRDLSLGGDLGIEHKLEMLPLTEPQMQAFIRAYIPEQAEAMLRQLKDRLREFGQTPLLLWMLCEVFQQAPNNQLPSNLGGVFQAFTKMYEQSSVRKHEVALLKGDVRPLSDRRLWKKALMAIADIMMQGKTPVDFRVAIHREEAERELSRVFPNENFPVRDILDDLLKYHLLQNRSADQIEFRHQLIQEYYAAEYLLKLLPTLTDAQLKQDYLNYLKWTEPMTLMMALLEDETQALRVVKLAMDEVDLMLGARLAGEVNSTFQTTTVPLIDVEKLPIELKIQCWEASRSEVAIKRLQSILKDSNYFVRRRVATVLGRIGSETAVDALLGILNDSDFEVRRRVVEALGRIGHERTADVMLIALNDSDFEVRRRAAEILRTLDTERAINVLLRALNDANSCVRSKAAKVLGEIGSEKAVDGLLGALNDLDFGVRKEAAEALGRIDSEKAVNSLLSTLNDLDFDTRRKAAAKLGHIGSERAVDGLLDALSDLDSRVRWRAATALGEIGSERAVEGLLVALNDSESGVRWRAAAALGEISSERAVEGLLVALNDSESSVRWRVAKALGKISNERAMNSLLVTLQSSDKGVRRRAAEALGGIGSERAVNGLLGALNDSEAGVRRRAAEALGKIGSERAVNGLLGALNDSEAGIRWRAAKALGMIGSEGVVDSLLISLNDSDSGVRRRAAEALGGIGSEKAVDSLMLALHGSDKGVRRRAAEALGGIGSKKAVDSLLAALDDSDSGVRKEAAKALRIIGDARLLADLWQLYRQRVLNELWNVISAIQNRCQFYNYEIFQAHLAVQKADRQTQPNSDPNVITIQTLERLTIMTDKSPIFNQQHATIGVNYAAEGSKVEFTQHTNSSEQTFELLLTDYQQFIQQLQQKYPTVADQTTVPQIIEVEAKLIEAQDQRRWQNFLNLKRLWNGSKKAGVKVGEHFAENNVWAKGAIAFLEGVSEDTK